MGISFSAHISNKSSAITGKSKLSSVAKHNIRLYKTEVPKENCIEIIKGSEELYDDVTTLYHTLFDEALMEYNKNQKREDRQIRNYFDSVCQKSQDIAVEMIVQIGDIDFWTKQKEEDSSWKSRVSPIYKSLLTNLEELLPEFKIANAVIHFDEASPHMHIVGVPIRTNCSRGLKVQVSKRDVFTKDTLSNLLQGQFREYANTLVKSVYQDELVVKKQGRNHDLTVTEYKVQQEEKRLAEAENKVQEALKTVSENMNQAKSLEELADEKGKELDDTIQRLAFFKDWASEMQKKAETAVEEYNLLVQEHDSIDRQVNEFYRSAHSILPEAKPMMTAKTYKEKFVDPFVGKVVSLVHSALNAFQNLLYQFRQLKEEHEKLKQNYKAVKDNYNSLNDKNKELEARSSTLYSIEDYLGDDNYKTLVDRAEQYEQLEYEKHQVKVR